MTSVFYKTGWWQGRHFMTQKKKSKILLNVNIFRACRSYSIPIINSTPDLVIDSQCFWSTFSLWHYAQTRISKWDVIHLYWSWHISEVHIGNETLFWYCYVKKVTEIVKRPLGLEAFLISPGLFFPDGSSLHINPAQPSISWTEIWGKFWVPLEVSAWTFLLLLLINYLPEVWLGIPCWNTTQCCVFPFFASHCSLFALLSMPVDSRSISSLEMRFQGLGNTPFGVPWIMYGTVSD